MNALPKYVVSRSMKRADWQRTQVIDGDLVSAVRALESSAGPSIAARLDVLGDHLDRKHGKRAARTNPAANRVRSTVREAPSKSRGGRGRQPRDAAVRPFSRSTP